MRRKIKYGIIISALLFPVMTMAQVSSQGMATGSTYSFGTLTTLLIWIFGVVGVLSLLGIPISGIMYVASGSDDDRISRAKRFLLTSIISLVISIIVIIFLNLMQPIYQ